MKFFAQPIRAKFTEALGAVLPVGAIVLVLGFTIAPIPSGTLIAFLTGAAMLILGMMLFTLGADTAMSPMGELIGTRITQSRKAHVMLLLGFALGVLITVSEPDLQVLAQQVQSVPNVVLIATVAVGVGLFLCVAMLRMLLGISLNRLLVVCYGVVFALAALIPQDFVAVAFDSGGVTTGPMTVPFIMALGIGVSAIRSDKHSANDSFGLVALSSIGPILAVLLLGLIYRPDGAQTSAVIVPEVADSIDLRRLLGESLPTYLREMAVSLLPIAVFFTVFDLVALRLPRAKRIRIAVGIGYTYAGLVIFLAGANFGFMPMGYYLGQTLAALPYRWILIPVGMLIGYFIVMAEPAIYVLMRQVEELTDGAIPGSAMKRSLSIGVAVSVGLAMLRVLTGISILWLLVPGYVLAIGLSFFTPKLFTAIAFDSGGVASGPMTATFLLPLAMGGCAASGSSMMDAFGVVAMVAMTPLITIQALGLLYQYRTRKAERNQSVPADRFAELPDNAIIDL